jgi:DNA-binding CsgD family transcriptional regulator
MKRSRHQRSDKELAQILPEIYRMRKAGKKLEELSLIFGIAESTACQYFKGYKDHLDGIDSVNSRAIGRAIPYFESTSQADSDFDKKRYKKNFLSGEKLAKTLVIIKNRSDEGALMYEIASELGLGRSTVAAYYNGYVDYLDGRQSRYVKIIKRAIPYLKKPIESPTVSAKEPVREVFKDNRTKIVSLFWGAIKIQF